MGKAIVIPGLVVNNPLVTVTFEGVESVLAKYYAANSTINATEKAIYLAELFSPFEYSFKS